MALRRHIKILTRQVLRASRLRPAMQPAQKNAVVAVAAIGLSLGVAAVIADMASVGQPHLQIVAAVKAPRTVATTQGAMIPTSDDEWLNKVTSKAFWNNIGKSSGGSNRSRERAGRPEPPTRLGASPSNGLVKVLSGRPDDDGDGLRDSIVGDEDANDGSGRRRNRQGGSDGGDTYRTVCVRLCDGFYTPLSFSTTKDKLERDAERCESSCGGQAKMFYYRNPGSEIDDMEDMDGKPYKKLATAFRFRTSYNAQCTCRPQPWSQEALERHKLYALQDASSKGDKAAKQQAEDLFKRMKKAEADAAAERAASVKALKKADVDAAAERKALDKAARQAKTNGKAASNTVAVSSPAGLELVGAAMSVPATETKQKPLSAKNDRHSMSVSPARARKDGIMQKAPFPSQAMEPVPATNIRAADVGSDGAIRSN